MHLIFHPRIAGTPYFPTQDGDQVQLDYYIQGYRRDVLMVGHRLTVADNDRIELHKAFKKKLHLSSVI